jgi:hypothetical protein
MFVSLRNYLIQEFTIFLKAVLSAVKDNRIKVMNWDNKILKLDGADVWVSTPDFWAPQKTPAVTVEVSSVNADFTSIAKGFSRLEEARKRFVYLANSTIDLTCFGRSVQERDMLVDLVSFFLMRKDAFDYFSSRGIRFAEAVRVSGMGEESPPGQDFKIYFGSLSVSVNTETQLVEEALYTLKDIIVEYVGALESELKEET